MAFFRWGVGFAQSSLLPGGFILRKKAILFRDYRSYRTGSFRSDEI